MRNVIVYCEENLRRVAWMALMEKQHGVTAVHAVGSLPELQSLKLSDGQFTLLVDSSEVESGLVNQLAAALPDTGILLLIDDYHINEMVALLQAGATGLISRNGSVLELVQALIAVGRSEIVIPAELASKVMLALAHGEVVKQDSHEPLTERERQVLVHLAQGLTNKDIAQSLFLSVRTIEAHLRNIYNKLNITSRTEAVLWAVQHGYEA